MKKISLIIALLLLLTASLTFVACTGNGDDPSDSKQETVTTSPVSGSEEIPTAPGTSAEVPTEAPTEENTNYDELDTDGKWTKPY